MPAPKGHPLWGNPLKPKKYTPEELALKFEEYNEWRISNPWLKQDFIRSGESAGIKINLETERPPSIEEFCNFANIDTDTFGNYSKKEGYETYFGICSRIRQFINANHFSGGMVGAYNANIVTRKLGLTEKTDITTNGENISDQTFKLIIEDTSKK